MSTKKTLIPSVSVVTTRDDKGRKFIEVVEAAYNKARLSDDEAQRVNEASGLKDLIEQHIIDNRASNKYANEEVKSSYAYPSGYRVKGITEQTNRLRELLPGVGYADEQIINQPLPEGAEGWFAIPRWEQITPTYEEAVKRVFILLKETRDGKFYNCREDQLGLQSLRQHDRTVRMFQILGEQQQGKDILVVPAQFGLRHRGRSVRRAREVFKANEFGLGSFAVGCILLTHPEREIQWEQLHIDCAGDEVSPIADGGFSDAPYFGFGGDGLRFGFIWTDFARESYGSASGFLFRE